MNVNIDIDQDTQTTHGQELVEVAPEVGKKKLNPKMIMGMSAAALALVSGLAFIGNTIFTSSERATKTTEATIDYSGLPGDAKQFISKYGSRFSDPVSVYLTEYGYEQSGNKSLMLSDEAVANYDMSIRPTAEKSPLVSFERYNLPVTTGLDQNTAVKIFNEYTAKELTLYMNALAKNPSAKAQEVIDFEFTNYCSNDELSIDYSKYTQNLMAMCKAMVAKYGNSTQYIIGKGALKNDIAPGDTYISSDVPNQGQENSTYKMFSNQAVLSIETLTTSDQGSNSTQEYTTGTIEFIYYRDNNSTKLSIGQIGKFEITK